MGGVVIWADGSGALSVLSRRRRLPLAAGAGGLSRWERMENGEEETERCR